MNNLDLLLDGIKEDGQKEAEHILSNGQKRKEEIIKESEEKAQREISKIIEKAQKEAVRIKENSKVTANRQARDIKIEAKNQVVEEVLEKLIKKLGKLGPNAYKEFVLNRLKNSGIEKGEILLQKDMKIHFKEEDFDGLKISDESVEGGFAVKEGKILYDNTYKSLVNFEKDSLEKIIVDEIFKWGDLDG